MTYREALKEFNETIRPGLPKNDLPALRQEWNDWTDHLCKSGRITKEQYETWEGPGKWTHTSGG